MGVRVAAYRPGNPSTLMLMWFLMQQGSFGLPFIQLVQLVILEESESES